MFITDMAHVTLYVVSLEQQSCSQGIYWDCVPRHSMHGDSEERICVGPFLIYFSIYGLFYYNVAHCQVHGLFPLVLVLLFSWVEKIPCFQGTDSLNRSLGTFDIQCILFEEESFYG